MMSTQPSTFGLPIAVLFIRFSSRDVVGAVSVQLGDADLYGMTTKMQIQKATLDNSVSACFHVNCSFQRGV